MMNILIIGAGKLGVLLVNALKDQHNITLVSRSQKNIDGVHEIVKNAQDLTAADFNVMFDVVFVIISPDVSTIADYYRTYVATAEPICNSIRHAQNGKYPNLFYISSVRVYADSPNDIITSNTVPMPTDEFARLIYAGELIYQGLLGDRVSVVRLTGLTDFCPLTKLHKNDWLAKRAISATHVNELHWLNLVHRKFVVCQLIGLLNHLDNLKSVYLFNQLSSLRHELYNQIRAVKKHKPLTISHLTDNPANLTVTGKRIVVTDCCDDPIF
ncbi:Rossmann-fold NAD(P)-binding domain-containing protein [Moraxella macacae]|nr:hypothetical protein [Moraxella macacae]